jgi:hypothetical protein
MNQPSNVYSVYDASGTTGVGKGNREDLVNTVYDISPTETPTLTALGRTTAKAVLHEWTTHALATAAANEKVEGDDATIDAATAKTRLNNRCAISNKVAGVTKTQQAVDKVGMQDAMAEEVGYKLKEIKRDMNLMIHANTAKVAGDDSTARKTAGIPTARSARSWNRSCSKSRKSATTTADLPRSWWLARSTSALLPGSLATNRATAMRAKRSSSIA